MKRCGDMDIKLKSNSKLKTTIGRKLLSSYLIILLVVFVMSLTVYNNISRAYLVNKAVQSLDEEATQILRLVHESEKVPRPRDLERVAETIVQARFANEIRLAGRFFDSKIAIVTNQGKIRYASERDLTFESLREIAESAVNNTEYIFKREPLVVGDRNIGYVILYTAVDEVVGMRKIGFTVFTISFGVGAVLALLISLFFQRMIGRPIRLLGHAMSSYSFDEPVEDMDIHTGDEIEELYDTFKKMAIKIQTYHSQQKKFFQNASHELKTPLMSIQGYAEAIKDGVGEEEESLDIIIEESQRLKKIVEEMILLTKLDDEQESFRLSEAKIGEILRGAVRTMQPVFDKNTVRVEMDIQDDGAGAYDVDKMTRAFINILGNCARYANERIGIRAQTLGNQHRIEIFDDGPGFEPGEIERIFERFYKGRKGGTGIGLALTQTIIERHAGQVWAENRPQGGAMFVIELHV